MLEGRFSKKSPLSAKNQAERVSVVLEVALNMKFLIYCTCTGTTLLVSLKTASYSTK